MARDEHMPHLRRAGRGGAGVSRWALFFMWVGMIVCAAAFVLGLAFALRAILTWAAGA